MVKYFKTLTIKIPNMFRNNLNRNVYLKTNLSGKLFAIKKSDQMPIGVDEIFAQ